MGANRVTYLALCVLQDAVDQSRAGAVAPSLGLRLALAHLYAAGERRGAWFDREPYDGFWTIATQQVACGDNAEAFGRFQHLNAHLNAMARAAGMEMDVTMLQRVRATLDYRRQPGRDGGRGT